MKYSLSFGNLILAKRASNTKKISHGHRNGPFLVLENKDGVLSCLYATSNEQAESLLKISKKVIKELFRLAWKTVNFSMMTILKQV